MDITELTVHELQEKMKNKELTSYEITKALFNIRHAVIMDGYAIAF